MTRAPPNLACVKTLGALLDLASLRHLESVSLLPAIPLGGQYPPPTGVRETVLLSGASVLLEEVDALCAKSAVESLPPMTPGKQGYYSTYFLVPKKDGGVRPFLNL